MSFKFGFRIGLYPSVFQGGTIMAWSTGTGVLFPTKPGRRNTTGRRKEMTSVLVGRALWRKAATPAAPIAESR